MSETECVRRRGVTIDDGMAELAQTKVGLLPPEALSDDQVNQLLAMTEHRADFQNMATLVS